jgi:hypothetical protein
MEIITLKNGLKFVILAKLELNDEKYLYLSSYDDDINIIFAKVNDDKTIEPIDDGETIVELLKLIEEKQKKDN